MASYARKIVIINRKTFDSVGSINVLIWPPGNNNNSKWPVEPLKQWYLIVKRKKVMVQLHFWIWHPGNNKKLKWPAVPVNI